MSYDGNTSGSIVPAAVWCDACGIGLKAFREYGALVIDDKHDSRFGRIFCDACAKNPRWYKRDGNLEYCTPFFLVTIAYPTMRKLESAEPYVEKRGDTLRVLMVKNDDYIMSCTFGSISNRNIWIRAGHAFITIAKDDKIFTLPIPDDTGEIDTSRQEPNTYS